MYSVTLQQMLP